jgi:hypothetical protein
VFQIITRAVVALALIYQHQAFLEQAVLVAVEMVLAQPLLSALLELLTQVVAVAVMMEMVIQVARVVAV